MVQNFKPRCGVWGAEGRGGEPGEGSGVGAVLGVGCVEGGNQGALGWGGKERMAQVRIIAGEKLEEQRRLKKVNDSWEIVGISIGMGTLWDRNSLRVQLEWWSLAEKLAWDQNLNF